MEPDIRDSAERTRALLSRSELAPDRFRAALTSVPCGARDAWLDAVLGLEGPADDGPDLPPGCVPYLPCAVDVVLRLVDEAGVQASDVFVDVGAGVGRAAALVHLLTGASTIGIEIQRGLVGEAHALKARLGAARFVPVLGDAAALAGQIALGTVFFLYCPFGGERLERVLGELESIARTREIRVCCVDLPLPSRPWLELSSSDGGLTVYRSHLER